MTSLIPADRAMEAAGPQLSALDLELIAARFKVLSEVTRLKLIAALHSGPRNVTELVQATSATQANVSRHLQTLTQAGILSRHKRGLKVYYSIADPAIFTLCEHVCGSVKERLLRQSQALAGRSAE